MCIDLVIALTYLTMMATSADNLPQTLRVILVICFSFRTIRLVYNYYIKSRKWVLSSNTRWARCRNGSSQQLPFLSCSHNMKYKWNEILFYFTRTPTTMFYFSFISHARAAIKRTEIVAAAVAVTNCCLVSPDRRQARVIRTLAVRRRVIMCCLVM